MGAAQIREELHQFINQADERVLRLIYGMMKADIEEGDSSLTEAHKKILDERLAIHESASHEGSSWEEVKARIRKER
jgi:putative addiction module component (TIGR02574 family)